jgi:hypothetical protein
MVLLQQGSCIDLGEVLQCISLLVLSARKNNCPAEQDLELSQLTDEFISEAWEHLQEYIMACPHHRMEEWFIIQSFYYGWTRSAQEYLGAAAGGAFFSLGIGAARELIEKMVSSQS